MSQVIKEHPLRYTFGYIAGFIFIIGIMIYIYLLIIDTKDNSIHTIEEKIWIILFLILLILGFFLSYYSITCSIYCKNKLR